jgi:glycosyltransferase involved in cell wall biosynthesis
VTPCRIDTLDMKVSVVIPAHNRPAFLREAVRSVAEQTHGDWELVVVDDGSSPPVDTTWLKATVGNRGVFLRHEVPYGVARAKNAGLRAATGDVVTLLDDDDLLQPNALAVVATAFQSHPELDCVFLAVEPFGPYAKAVADSRRRSIEPFQSMAARQVDGLYLYDERLFGALVRSVPIDFQRPAARKGAWNIIGGFDEAGLFSESAWAIRASMMCRIALTVDPLTCWRIHDSNFGWLEGGDGLPARLRQADNTLASARALVEQVRRERANVNARLAALEARLADNYFDKAYVLRGERSLEGLRALVHSMALRPRLHHLKLLLRYLLPKAVQ